MVSLIPRSFLFVLPLQIGAEIIAACAILNKVSAVYALGALFTGHGLTVMQWIMNMLSLSVFPISVWGWLSIFHRKSLNVLAFTYVYTLDTFVSLGFTIYFIVYWFAVAGKAANNPGAPTQTAVASSVSKRAAPTAGYGSSSAAALDKSMTVGQEIAMTVVATTLFLIVRFYFMMVLIGYARVLCKRTGLRSNNCESESKFVKRVQFLLVAPFEKFWTGKSRLRGDVSERERLTSE